jgi:2-aminoadipate transaminase
MKMQKLISQRIHDMPKSFVRDILKVTTDPGVISFAGGLPSADTFPIVEIAEATACAMGSNGQSALQYSTTQGLPALRRSIGRDLQQRSGRDIDPDEILITSGSQQGLDLIGKVFLDKGDTVVMERPGYLGAIQALRAYEPRILTVPLRVDGIDLDELKRVLDQVQPKLVYVIPNFQNPSGISYSGRCRETLVGLLRERELMLVEDDPYGQLRFEGKSSPLLKSLLPEQTILLGTFSKTVAPGLRVGWLHAPRAALDRLIVAKQGADLHTSSFAQRVLLQYLTDNDVGRHIQDICQTYRKHRDTMIQAINEHFPKEVRFNQPQGGMFLWVTLPKGLSSLDLFDLALKEKVAFVPGTPFYTDGGGMRHLRLNFSNADEQGIEIGIWRLGKALESLMGQQ